MMIPWVERASSVGQRYELRHRLAQEVYEVFLA